MNVKTLISRCSDKMVEIRATQKRMIKELKVAKADVKAKERIFNEYDLEDNRLADLWPEWSPFCEAIFEARSEAEDELDDSDCFARDLEERLIVMEEQMEGAYHNLIEANEPEC